MEIDVGGAEQRRRRGTRGGILIAGGGTEMTGGRGHGISSNASWAWHGQRRLERSKLGSLADSGAVERGAGSGMARLRGRE
ncbi:hypothetical protein M0R45_001300 [Rubus argutus]|uniref:Uncharacterized protein n=1 Tax=Rubus argutus TaxID=59490 RepID=A0AAW1VLX3_RUBAR